MRTRAVLDAWAVIAVLQGEEPAATVVATVLRRAGAGNVRLSMCLVNLGEAYYKIARRFGEDRAEREVRALRRVPVEFVAVREPLAIEAARLKTRHALGYADAFAVATARREEAPLFTGDAAILALPRDVVAVRRLTRD